MQCIKYFDTGSDGGGWGQSGEDRTEPQGKNADLAIPEVFRIEETDAGSLYGHADTV